MSDEITSLILRIRIGALVSFMQSDKQRYDNKHESDDGKPLYQCTVLGFDFPALDYIMNRRHAGNEEEPHQQARNAHLGPNPPNGKQATFRRLVTIVVNRNTGIALALLFGPTQS